MRFEVLGPLRVRSRSAVPFPRAAHRRLLSILLLDPGRSLTAEELIDRHWPEEMPRTARAALHTHLSQLRAILGVDTLATVDGGYRIDLRSHQLDREAFEALASAARTALQGSAWGEVVESADRALELWRGSAYPELQGDEFAAPVIAQLEEQRMQLVELRAEALLALGRAEAALPDLERAVTQEPLRERLWEHLMTARARLGRITEALTAYHELRRILDEVGLEPNQRLRDLEERILREDPALVPPSTRHNLPPRVSSFVGREAASEELARLLDHHRLVTLTGVGGAGKTRLAVEVARRRLADHPDGVWLIDLIPVTDPAHVLSTVAGTLGIPSDASAETSIRSVLRQRRSLVILDNCEHLVVEAARVAEVLLAAGPGVTVLGTSREALKVPGERVYPLRPLEVPADGLGEPAEILATESGRLYAERAGLVVPGFEVTDAIAPTIATICRRLDGLPLAIELVAAQAGALPPDLIARRLAEGIGAVTDPGHHRPTRQRAMRATIAWSEDLLTDVERRLLARLSVFIGGFTTTAVEAVCGWPPVEADATVGTLARLVETSLVEPIVEDGVPVRYRLLEPIRAFARARLEECGETDAVARRHRDHYRRLATDLLEAPASEPSGRLEQEHGNLEAALEWSIRHGDAGAAAELTAQLSTFWLGRGQARRATNVLRRTLESVDLTSLPDMEALLHTNLANAYHEMADDEAALAAAGRATELVHGAADSMTKVRALIAGARYRLFVVHEDPYPAIALAEEALAAALATSDPGAELRARLMLGHALAWNGEGRAGLSQKREALRLADDLDDPTLVLAVYGSFFDALALDGEARRCEPRRLIDEMTGRFGHTEWWNEHAPWPWMAYVYMQCGELDEAQTALDHARAGHIEGYIEMWAHHVTGALRWMQGRLSEARDAAAALRALRPAPRWYHDFYPLAGEIAAAMGDLEGARSAAEEYLAVRVHASEAAMKAAVLVPVVRAEVDAALAGGRSRDRHVARARAARNRAHEIVSRFPPPGSGCLQFETPRTHLLLADAELSRATGPDPAAWRSVADAADYAHTRLYARWRRAEALLALDRVEEAREAASGALADARRMGAGGIAAQLGRLLSAT